MQYSLISIDNQLHLAVRLEKRASMLLLVLLYSAVYSALEQTALFSYAILKVIK